MLRSGIKSYFESTPESVHQKRKEKYGASREETVCGLGKVVEDAADDESHDAVAEQLREGQGWITLQSPKPTSKTEFNLSSIRESIWTRDALMLRLLNSSRFFKFLEMLPADNILFVVRINFSAQAGVLWARLPGTSKVVRRSRDPVLEFWSYYTFKWAGHRGEEVGCRLPPRTFETKINEIFFRSSTWTEIDLPTFVENQHLIKCLMVLVRDQGGDWILTS
jgi:hypothetical protein